MVADEAVRVDQIPRRPVAIVVGVPGGAVVVEDDGVADACLFDGLLDAGTLLDQGQPASERCDVDLPGRMDQAVAGRLLAYSGGCL